MLGMVGFSQLMAGAALFTRCHTLGIEAERLCHTRFPVSPTELALIGKMATPLPFERSMLSCLTMSFNAGSLSSSNTQTHTDLTNSIEQSTKCFPKLLMLTIEIEWDIDEVEERFAPL
jgi:hypothetical protein